MEHKYFNKDTVIEGENKAFFERMQQNAIRLTEFFEESGVGEPASKILERGFVVKPAENLVSSFTRHASGYKDSVPRISIDRAGQTPTPIGDHIQTHELGHTFSRDELLHKISTTLFPDGHQEEKWRTVQRSGFHYRHSDSQKEHTTHLFSALNEALTDSIPLKVIEGRNWAVIYKYFLYKYPRERNMLATIIASLAKEGGDEEGEAATFRLFVQS